MKLEVHRWVNACAPSCHKRVGFVSMYHGEVSLCAAGTPAMKLARAMRLFVRSKGNWGGISRLGMATPSVRYSTAVGLHIHIGVPYGVYRIVVRGELLTRMRQVASLFGVLRDDSAADSNDFYAFA